MGGLEGPTAPDSLSLTHVLVVHSRTLTHSLARGVKSNFAVLCRSLDPRGERSLNARSALQLR